MDSILENPLGLIHPDSSEWPAHKHVDKHRAFPTDGVKLSIICQGKKEREITGFQSHNELRVVKLLHAEKLILASLALHFDVKEAVMLIVPTD